MALATEYIYIYNHFHTLSNLFIPFPAIPQGSPFSDALLLAVQGSTNISDSQGRWVQGRWTFNSYHVVYVGGIGKRADDQSAMVSIIRRKTPLSNKSR